MAETFEDDLLEIANEDASGTMQEELKSLAARHRRVADLGCGPGSLLPFLARTFEEVIAVDYSEGLLEAARARGGGTNITYECHDLSHGTKLPFSVDLTCCVNALIDPDRAKRERMAATVAGATSTGGAALVVVPAFESVFHVYHSLLRCGRRDSEASGLTTRAADASLRAETDSFAGGIVRVGEVPTRWMREEIVMLLRDHGLEPRKVRRIEYPWAEEIDDPPEWLGAPFPWDWLVVCRKPEGGGR